MELSHVMRDTLARNVVTINEARTFQSDRRFCNKEIIQLHRNVYAWCFKKSLGHAGGTQACRSLPQKRFTGYLASAIPSQLQQLTGTQVERPDCWVSRRKLAIAAHYPDRDIEIPGQDAVLFQDVQ